MVLISLAIVFAGLGAMSLSSADSGTADASGSGAESSSETGTPQGAAAPTTQAGAGSTASSDAGATSTTSTDKDAPTGSADGTDRSAAVRVLNNSMVSGLAGDTAEELGNKGWTNTATGNYAGSNIANTTVYYGDSSSDKEAAEAVADDLGAEVEVAPNPGDVGDDSSSVVVVVTGK